MTSKSVRTRYSDSNSITQYNGITITGVNVTDASYNWLDDTAVNTAGGYIQIKGYGFVPGCKVYFNNALVSNTYISSSEYRAIIPATSAGSYPLMIFDSRLNTGSIYANLVTSGFPSFTTTSYTSVRDVSVQLAATGDASLTFTLYSGTLPSGLSLSSSGLISGTATSTSTTTFDVIVTDPQNQSFQQTITLVIVDIDLYWANTTLLLTGEPLGSNNTTSNSATIFSDSSPKNFYITVNGDCRPSHFTPFTSNNATDGAAYFDGSGDYLVVASNTAFGLGTEDFTVECWVYPTVNARQDWIDINDNNNKRVLLMYNGTNIVFYSNSPNSAVITGPAMTLNTWTHVAISKQSGNSKLFINGNQVGSTYTTNQDYGSTASVYIGKDGSGSTVVTGHMSNIRITKGQALYTSNTTITTSPLTTTSQGANSANVVLLTCQKLTSNNNNLIIDASIHQRAISKTGTPNFSSFNPFQPNWSVYFGSKTDYLATGATSALTTFTGDFTMEAWIYPTDTTITNWGVYDARQSAATSANFLCSIDPLASPVTGQGRMKFFLNNSSVYYGTTTVYYNRWTHVAWVRSGSTLTFYVNGVAGGTATVSGTITGAATTNPVWIGTKDNGSASYGSTGYISNFRIAKQAVYTGNFTPSTTPLTTTSQSANSANVLLIACNSYGYIDNSNTAARIIPTGTASVISFSPFNGANTYSYDDNGTSMYLAPASGNYVTCTANNDFLQSANNFTIEAWIYPTTNAAARGISNNWQVGGAWIFIVTSANVLEFSFTDAASGISTKALTGTTRYVTANSWNHVAVVRNGNTGSLYVNGIADATTYNFTGVTIYNYNGAAKQFRIGVGGDLGSPYVGYISNYRFINGNAAYTSNFTPPVRPFGYREYAANAKILLSGATTSILDSTMQNTLQVNGDVRLLPNTSKWGAHSYSFDGTGDYISVYAYVNTALSCYFGTGDFTIEAWLYPTTVAKAMTVIDSRTSAASTTGLALNISATGFPSVVINNATLFTSSTALTANTWTHVAVVRYGTTVTLYLDGTKPTTGSGTSSTSCTDRDVTIGTSIGNRDTTATNHYQGYIDDLRVTRGYARYIANFTVSSSPNIAK